jgi:CRISPR-associated endonuclease/helicase Cas3
LLAVKAAVIAADAAASGLAREGYPITTWLREAFTETLTADAIDQHIIQKRKRAIETKTKRRFEFQSFQNAAASLPDRALLIAPCGAGKTLAAWRWIAARLGARPAAHVIFLYPTRATATEGFRDYVSYAPESDAALLTGTARYELQDMFSNPVDERHGRDYLTEDRLYALGFWQKRVFSATVDQFLAFLQQSYRGICLLPVLADSVVVIDEVHSFDAGLFSALVSLLQNFDLPVLCMTASLPAKRRKKLEECGLTIFPGEANQFEDLDRRAQLLRYKVEKRNDAGEAEHIARQAIREGRRVLWVVNTVDRCQSLARKLEDLKPLCYHSRYRLQDRKDRHYKVIDAFQNHEGGVLAITTQVCEMSLDLNAHVLISEVAPIPALIQRMGRCNRRTEKESDPMGEVYLHFPEADRPYPREELQTALKFIEDIADQGVSQAQLQELLESYTARQETEVQRLMTFLVDGFWSRGGMEELRDGEDYTVPAILDHDVESFLSMQTRHEPVDGLILNVPRKSAHPDGRLPGYLSVASSSHYDPQRGFCKEPLPKASAL